MQQLRITGGGKFDDLAGEVRNRLAALRDEFRSSLAPLSPARISGALTGALGKHASTRLTRHRLRRPARYTTLEITEEVDRGDMANEAHQNFIIRIEVRTPVILNPSIGFDGVLASLVYDRTHDLEQAHDGLPLACRHGIYQASQIFLEQPAPRTTVPLVRNMKPGMGLTPDMVRPDRGSRLPRIRTHRGSYRTLMNRYDAYLPTAIWAFGRGEASRIEDLTSDLAGIGKKRNQGFGQIERIEMETLEGDELYGLRGADGSPARAVPVDVWRDIDGADDAVTEMVPASLPRWDAEPVECVVPETSLVSTHRLHQLLG